MAVKAPNQENPEQELVPAFESPAAERRLLSFYDRLRDRVSTRVEGRGGRLGSAASTALLLVPDIFILLLRLSLDREVPAENRRLLGGALLYFLVPLDLFPEMFVGPAGYLDDLVLACVVLAQALGPEVEARAAAHWNGPTELRLALTQIVRSAESLLGGGLYARLRALLARRGLEL
jgi:uncharacterized membrane protein YkvA (DUF1232 family)